MTIEQRGEKIKQDARQIVLDFMKATPECAKNAKGLPQAQISRRCCFEWGDYENTTASNQQHWTAGLLQQMQGDGLVARDMATKLWRLK